MDRQTVVNLIRNEMVECPKGTSRLWAVRCFEITARPDEAVVEVDEYEAYEVCEEGDGSQDGGNRHAGPGNPSKMHHVGRSVIHLEENRVVHEAGRKDRIETGVVPAGR